MTTLEQNPPFPETRHGTPPLPEVPARSEDEVLGDIVKRELDLAQITLQWPFKDGLMASQATRFTHPPPDSLPGVFIHTHFGSPIRSPIDTTRATITQNPQGLFQVAFPVAETGIELTLSGLASVVPRVTVLQEDEPVAPTDALIIRQGDQLGSLGAEPLGIHMTYLPYGLTTIAEPQRVNAPALFSLFPPTATAGKP